MNNLIEKAIVLIRSTLLNLARKLKVEYSRSPIVRESKSLFSKEIKIPPFISITFTFVIIYCMFVIDFGICCKMMLAVAIFTTATAAFFIIQAQSDEKSIMKDDDAVVLMCLFFIIAILMFQTSKELISPFVSPVAAFALMASLLLSPRIGILYVICLSLSVAFLNYMSFDIFLVMFCGGIIGITNVGGIRRRSDFINSGIKVALANVAIMIMFYFFDVYSTSQLKYNIFYGILNGAFTIIIVLVFMPLFEKVFSRITSIKLIELSDFNNVLLKRLMLEAPGTYHHSIIAADIAEHATNSINENSLLARIGAYYHDIGKLKNPQYFIENQTSGRNPHDGLAPAMSSLILVSHVKDGVALAKKHNIDDEIINIIEQYHGTTPMHVFYHRALKLSLDINVEIFKYPGPKPATKIAAIVMLADSCEAACRSIKKPTAIKIKDAIEKIINNKFTDGQFSDCPITLKDLEAVRDSIIATVIGIYHARIGYKGNEKG